MEKQLVKDFWNKASCGEELLLNSKDKEGFNEQMRVRYLWEPEIAGFADFHTYKEKSVLEIGVGLGCEHQLFAEAGAVLTGIDLTERAVENTRVRFELFNLSSQLLVGDAEKLPFGKDSFDLVYSWGVMHHSPDTQQCIDESFRVLKPGGEAKIMIYHKYSMVGYMLWFRYALLTLKPFRSLDFIYAHYLESPGTKAYSVKEARQLFHRFAQVEIHTYLGHADLLSSAAGQRHQGVLLTLARILWPVRLIKRLLPSHGLFMTIRAVK